MAELTPYGFEREDYKTLLEKVKDKFREKFGNGIALDDENVAGQFAALLALFWNEMNKLAEAVVSTQTLNGAEGVYLDDIFSRGGVFRRGKQVGSGNAVIEMNNLAANNYNLEETTQFKASNGKTYQPETDILVSTVVTAFKLSTSDLANNTSYTFTFKSTIDGTDQSLILNSGSTTESKLILLETLLSFVLGNSDGNVNNCFINNNTLYLGYEDVGFTVIGLAETTELTITPVVGVKHSAIPVVCTEAGYFPVPSGDLKQMTPTFTGFVKVTNLIAFNPGSEVETDAEYRVRYFTEIEARAKTSRDGIAGAILDIEGVQKVRIYDNPTAIGQVEADPFSFNTIVLGGTTAEISQAIYDSKPINTTTSGTTSQTVNTLDGDTEVIRHTKAVQSAVDLRIKYKTSNRLPLSNIERQAIQQSLNDFFTTLNIGDTIYNTKLVFTVLSSSGSSRIRSVEVQIKRVTQNATLFVNSDFEPNFDEILTLNQAGLDFQLQL